MGCGTFPRNGDIANVDVVPYEPWPAPDEARLSGPGSTRLRLLVYGHIALGALVAVVAPSASQRSWIVFVYHAVLLGQLLLISIWMGIATRDERRLSVIVRGAAYLTAVVAALTVAIGMHHASIRPSDVVEFLALLIFPVLGFLLPITVVGMVLHALTPRLGVVRKLDGAIALPRATQWSIKSMLIATAFVASIVALARVANPSEPYSRNNGATMLIYVIAIATLTTSLVWAVLGRATVTARVVIVILELVLFTTALGYVTGGFEVQPLVYAWLLFGPLSVLIAASLAVVRSCGFRLVAISEARQLDALAKEQRTPSFEETAPPALTIPSGPGALT